VRVALVALNQDDNVELISDELETDVIGTVVELENEKMKNINRLYFTNK
jgi:hypothetical protein